MKLNTVLLIVLIILAGAGVAAGIGIKMQGSVGTMKAAAEAEEHWHLAHCLRDRYTGEWYSCR